MAQIERFPLSGSVHWRAAVTMRDGFAALLLSHLGACVTPAADQKAPNARGLDSTDVMSEVRMEIDARGGGVPISPYIYGVNFYGRGNPATMPRWPTRLTLSRFGGNRLTAYNWENNASNAGNDYQFQNDAYLGGGDVPGEAVRLEVAGAAARGAGTIVTVPMIGYV